MSAHDEGVRCPVGARSPESAHQLGTVPECSMCKRIAEQVQKHRHDFRDGDVCSTCDEVRS